VAVASVVAAGCARKAPQAPAKVAAVGPAPVLSADGRFELRAPPDWVPTKKLSNNAVLQVASTRKEGSVLVLSKSKRVFPEPVSYRDYAKNTVEELRGLAKEGEIVRGPTDLMIDGRPAVRYEVKGKVKDLPIHYLHTTVDGKDALHQIVAASSQMEKHRQTIEDIVGSFRERK
jgi:hypothetical protein